MMTRQLARPRRPCGLHSREWAGGLRRGGPRKQAVLAARAVRRKRPDAKTSIGTAGSARSQPGDGVPLGLKGRGA
jgi:hypothetical protein